MFGVVPVSPRETITIHHQGWSPQLLPLRYSGNVLILGFHFQLDGSHQYQHLQTKQRLQLACTAMSTAIRSSLASVALPAMISSLSRGDLHGPVRRVGLYCPKGPGAPASQHLFFWHSGLDLGGCFSPPTFAQPLPLLPLPSTTLCQLSWGTILDVTQLIWAPAWYLRAIKFSTKLWGPLGSYLLPTLGENSFLPPTTLRPHLFITWSSIPAPPPPHW